MNIPTWLIVYISIMYVIWSYIEITGVIAYNEYLRRGHKVRYTKTSYTISVIWVMVTLAMLCYVIFG